ncbi:hypothetical protein DL96DRAFT_416008 [Flagelloscypha sp. PMI_526]|nr:hypothetical protein DL96DRAFT_416008 [Flagelloscypha sp. PMI_526]
MSSAAECSSQRPILHHLNADTSWLLQIPSKHNSFYNILIDPWLTGSQSDVAPWFSRQWHSHKPAYDSINAVEVKLGKVDLVVISHEFTDHCHRETLVQLPKATKIIAPNKAKGVIQKWKHFESVEDMPLFYGGDEWQQDTSLPAEIPVKVLRVVNESDALYYHSAILVTFPICDTAGSSTTVEGIIYTPHGILPAPLGSLPPTIKPLALLHGLHDVSLPFFPGQLNLGAHNALKALKGCGAKYWVGTHDEVKNGGGFVWWFLRRKVITVKEALEKAGMNNEDKYVKCLEVGNGGYVTLA